MRKKARYGTKHGEKGTVAQTDMWSLEIYTQINEGLMRGMLKLTSQGGIHMAPKRESRTGGEMRVS